MLSNCLCERYSNTAMMQCTLLMEAHATKCTYVIKCNRLLNWAAQVTCAVQYTILNWVAHCIVHTYSALYWIEIILNWATCTVQMCNTLHYTELNYMHSSHVHYNTLYWNEVHAQFTGVPSSQSTLKGPQDSSSRKTDCYRLCLCCLQCTVYILFCASVQYNCAA